MRAEEVAGGPVQAADHRRPGDDREARGGDGEPSEKALADIVWQPVQWQAEASSGGAPIVSRSWPQRQPPCQGSFQSSIARLPF